MQAALCLKIINPAFIQTTGWMVRIMALNCMNAYYVYMGASINEACVPSGGGGPGLRFVPSQHPSLQRTLPRLGLRSCSSPCYLSVARSLSVPTKLLRNANLRPQTHTCSTISSLQQDPRWLTHVKVSEGPVVYLLVRVFVSFPLYAHTPTTTTHTYHIHTPYIIFIHT